MAKKVVVRHLYLLRKNERKKSFFSKVKVAGILCRDKSEKKLLQEEKVAKVTRFLLRQLILATFSSGDFFVI